MPGSVKVSVLEAEQLPSTVKDGDLVSIRVSVGKREYQTKASQAFGGRTAPWRYEFSYPVTNLRDNLVIAALDSNEETITKSEIQTTSIIQKGLWESYFSFKGGGRLYLKLCFVLSDEERKKIETMRREALRRKGLQNLLYRSTFPMPKPVPIRPTGSFVSGVTITEISTESYLRGKDEDKENHATNMSPRCTRLLEAPKETKSLDSVNGSLAIVPFPPNPDNSKVKASISEGLLSPGLMSSPTCKPSEEVSKTNEDHSKADGSHLLANSNVASLLLPEASAFMNDHIPSTAISDVEQSPSPASKLGTIGISCETAADVAVANVGSVLLSPSDKTETEPSCEPELPHLSEESSVTPFLCPPGSENPASVVDSQLNEDASYASPSLSASTQNDDAVPVAYIVDTAENLSEGPKIVNPEDLTLGGVNISSTDPSLSVVEEMSPGSLTLNDSTSTDHLSSIHKYVNPGCSTMNGSSKSPANMEDANGVLQVSETFSDKVDVGVNSVRDAARKLELEKETEDSRRATLTTLNKVPKTLPWKSQMKGDSEKFGFNANKKKRAESERNALAAQNAPLVASATIEENEPSIGVDKETKAEKGLFGISGRVKKWAGVVLLLAGVVILGYDAIQRDCAAKESCFAKEGEQMCNVASGKKITRSSLLYPGQQIKLH